MAEKTAFDKNAVSGSLKQRALELALAKVRGNRLLGCDLLPVLVEVRGNHLLGNDLLLGLVLVEANLEGSVLLPRC